MCIFLVCVDAPSRSSSLGAYGQRSTARGGRVDVNVWGRGSLPETHGACQCPSEPGITQIHTPASPVQLAVSQLVAPKTR